MWWRRFFAGSGCPLSPGHCPHLGVTAAVNPHLDPLRPLQVVQGHQPGSDSRDVQGCSRANKAADERMPLKDAALILTEFLSLGCPDKSQLTSPAERCGGRAHTRPCPGFENSVGSSHSWELQTSQIHYFCSAVRQFLHSAVSSSAQCRQHKLTHHRTPECSRDWTSLGFLSLCRDSR